MLMTGTVKRAVIACGGTGGHFYPGHALAEVLRTRGWQTLFLLRKDDPAGAALTAEDLPFLEVDLRGMPRGLSPEWARFPWRVASSLRLTRNALRAFRPNCVVGMGGYLTFPAVLAAWSLRIPSCLHESNAILGLANRVCIPFVSTVALGLPPDGASSERRYRYEVTGTPVRPALLRLPAASTARRALGLDPGTPTILVFGGSQGARGINRLVPEALRLAAERMVSEPPRAGAARPGFQCLHLTGAKEEAAVRNAYVGAPFGAVVRGFLAKMELAYAAADLAVCRAGAGTLAELYAVRRPAVLIPFPSAAANHQEANARLLERAGAALCLRETELSASSLAAALRDLISSAATPESRLAAMARAYDGLRLPPPADAAAALARLVEALPGVALTA